MNGVPVLLRALRHGEHDLAEELRAAADRHRDEPDVHHVATDLARWSTEHAHRLAETAAHYGEPPDPAPSPFDAGPGRPPADPAPSSAGPAPSSCGFTPFPAGSGPFPVVRARTTEEPAAGLLLLGDLRALHLAAAGNSLCWQMLAQAAHATRDDRLLGLTSFCHPRTRRQMRWAETLLKNVSAQLLTA
ncbi:hypothetical protein [Streptomyces griseus]|uniref:hypothetical protein n=1 Tax=Streptomyces griseus TaxID=1911 RepID=UPI0004C62BD5|nr:hypothetical protein [Streptomyces griseus]